MGVSHSIMILGWVAGVSHSILPQQQQQCDMLKKTTHRSYEKSRFTQNILGLRYFYLTHFLHIQEIAGNVFQIMMRAHSFGTWLAVLSQPLICL